jgi:hypothetical protein
MVYPARACSATLSGRIFRPQCGLHKMASKFGLAIQTAVFYADTEGKSIPLFGAYYR